MKIILLAVSMITFALVTAFSVDVVAADEPIDEKVISVELRLHTDTPAGTVQRIVQEFAAKKFPNAVIKLTAIDEGTDEGSNHARVETGSNVQFSVVEDVLKYLNSQQHLKLNIVLANSTAKPPASTLPNESQAKDAESIKVFSLQSVDATECVHVIKDVYQSDSPSLAALDSQTLVARGSEERLAEIETLLQALDNIGETKTQVTDSPSIAASDVASVLNAVIGTSADVLKKQITLHRQLAADAEAKSVQLARQQRKTGNTDPDQAAAISAEVKTAFELRQKLQRLELAHLLQRTKNMSDAVERREKIAAEIVRRRVMDLLNPDFKWQVDADQTESAAPKSPVVRKDKEFKQNSVLVTAESELTAARMKEILDTAIASVGSEIGNVDVQFVNGQVIMRGAVADVNRLQEAIKTVEKTIEPTRDPLQTFLKSMKSFRDLITAGRVEEASKFTTDRSLAINYLRVIGVNDLRIEEVAVSRTTATLVASSPHSPDTQVMFAWNVVRSPAGLIWKMNSFRHEPKSDVNDLMDSFLQRYPDGKIVYLDAAGQPETTSVQLRFQRAPWESAVAWLGKQMNAELKIERPENLADDFTYQTESRIPPQQAYRIIRTEIRARGSDLLILSRGSQDDPSADGPASLRAQITAVNNGLLTVSVGRDDGLTSDKQLEVRRDGKFIGMVEVGFVDANVAMARPSAGYKGNEIDFKVGDTVLLMRDKSSEKDVPADVRHALKTVQQFMSLVREQRYAEAAKLTKFNDEKVVELAEMPRCEVVELIAAGKSVLAIGSMVDLGKRGHVQVVFALSGTVIEDIDVEDQDGLAEERTRFLKEYPQAKRIVLQPK